MLAIGPSTRAALAQDTSPKLGVVDTQRVLTESEPGKERLAAIESLREQLKARGEGLQSEAESLRQRIENLGPGAEAERNRLGEELQQQTVELQRFSDQANRDLEKRRNTVLGEIERIVMPVIEAIGREGGYTVISRKFESGYLFVDPQVDITDQVIARVNATSGESR